MASDSSTCACGQVLPRADLLSRNPSPNNNPTYRFDSAPALWR